MSTTYEWNRSNRVKKVNKNELEKKTGFVRRGTANERWNKSNATPPPSKRIFGRPFYRLNGEKENGGWKLLSGVRIFCTTTIFLEPSRRPINEKRNGAFGVTWWTLSPFLFVDYISYSAAFSPSYSSPRSVRSDHQVALWRDLRSATILTDYHTRKKENPPTKEMSTKQLNYITIIFIIITNRHTHACIRSAHIDFCLLIFFWERK